MGKRDQFPVLTARKCIVGVIGALYALLILPFVSSPAFAADTLPDAPAGTVQIWVDVESASAKRSLNQISLGQAASWHDVAAIETPFGRSGVFAAQTGPVNLRFAISGALTADVSVTYVDAGGLVLSEVLLRQVSITPSLAGPGGWIAWGDISAAPGENGDARPLDPARANLVSTGSDLSVWLVLVGAGGLLGGAMLLVLRVRRPDLVSGAPGDSNVTKGEGA